MSPTAAAPRRTPNQVFEYVLRQYFRRHPPYTRALDLAFLGHQPVKVRRYLTRACNSPEVIEALAHDVDPWTRASARRSPYWELLGQYRQLLKMPRRDKIRFIHQEHFATLPVFIIFETDVTVLAAVFENPNISTQMLIQYENYLQERGTGVQDRRILDLVQQTVSTKRSRVLKISAIHSAPQMRDPYQALPQVLPYLMDADPLVAESAARMLTAFRKRDVLRCLFRHPGMLTLHDAGSRFFWQLLDRLAYLYRDTRIANAPIPRLLRRRKRQLLEECQGDLSNPNHLLTIAHAHLDGDATLRRTAETVLPTEDLLAIIQDEHFQARFAFQILDVLKRHPQRPVRREVEELIVALTERGRGTLKEMESSTNAYFDILFSYSEQLLRDYESDGRVKLSDLAYLQELVNQVMAVPHQFRSGGDGETDGASTQLYERESRKAHLLWRATIGQYLGRLKQLDAALQDTWEETLADDFPEKELEAEKREAIDSLEQDYKRSINCHLAIDCAQCMKRTCAAERYLKQIDFFLSEMLDYVEQGAPPLLAAERQGKKNADLVA